MSEHPEAWPTDEDTAFALAASIEAALDHAIRQRLPIPVTDVVQALVLVLAKQVHAITSAGQYTPDKQAQCLEAVCRDLQAYFAYLDAECHSTDTPIN